MKTNSNGDQHDNEVSKTKPEKQSNEHDQDSREDDSVLDSESSEKEPKSRDNDYNELHERYLRLAADFDNYKKRVTREKADLIAYGNEELIRSLLSVLDNLERAIEHSESNEESAPIIEGIKLVQKQFLDCLEKFGVKSLEVKKGDEFDPNLHQAVERAKSHEVEPGAILSEMLKGYRIKERLLRPAIVSVSEEYSNPSKQETSLGSVVKDTKADPNTSDNSDLLNSDAEKK